MTERAENWRLILEAARSLTASGHGPFTRVSVYEWIWRRHPRSGHDRPSLDPTFQGMVKGATGGPRSLARTPLGRTNRRDPAARARQIQAALRAPQLRQPLAVQAAYAAVVTGQVALIRALNAQIEELGEVVASHFGQHRDAEIYLSQPGLGVVLGARVLAEFGDDPARFADARARKNYAGTAPITRVSGSRKIVLARYARNRRLADAVHQWAFCALRGSPGARAYYQTLRSRGIGRQAALRQLGNRLVGILHGCLKTRTTYDEHSAWDHHQQSAA